MSHTPDAAFKKLIDIVNTLMSENGCPWDRVQTRESLKPFLVEEAYETLEALDSNQPEKIKDERFYEPGENSEVPLESPHDPTLLGAIRPCFSASSRTYGSLFA